MNKFISVMLASSMVAIAVLSDVQVSKHGKRLIPNRWATQELGIGNGPIDTTSSELLERPTESLPKASLQANQPDFMRTSLARNRNPTQSFPLIGFCHPSNGQGYMSQGNNGRTHQGRSTYAYDIAIPIGTPVYAMRSGRVVAIRDKFPDTGGRRSNASKFNYVMIKHDGGYRSAYLHLKQRSNATVRLKEWDYVKAGQLIGYSGNSGWSLGPHLHIEVQKPSSGKAFKGTVPFKVSGSCPSDAIALNGVESWGPA